MDKLLLRMFLGQLQFQCHVVISSWREVETGVTSKNAMHVFVHMQNLLNAAANIAKVCWGQRGRLTAERLEVRTSIGLRDDSVLQDVQARNDFEHFDERLEQWWNQSPRHQYVELSIGPIGVIDSIPKIDRMRYFDPATGDLYSWGEHFNIHAIVAEVQRLQPGIDTAIMSAV